MRNPLASSGSGLFRSLGHRIGGAAGQATPTFTTRICRFKVGEVLSILEELTITGMAVKAIGKQRLINAFLDAG